MREPASRLVAFFALIVVLLTAPTHPGITNSTDRAKGLRVLFIGNSLTYTNDLPAVVGALAKATGQREFAYKSIALPNYSLEDHWKIQEARKAILKGGWDFVVLQQGPSASAEGRALLLEYARRFAEEIRKIGARPAFYSVWPAANRMQDFKGVSESYRQAAKDVGGLVFPVGDAWLATWKVNPSLPLYSPDRFHPSVAGTYLAGLVIYGQLYNRSPVGLPSSLRLGSRSIEIPPDQALLLQHAAEEANKL